MGLASIFLKETLFYVRYIVARMFADMGFTWPLYRVIKIIQ